MILNYNLDINTLAVQIWELTSVYKKQVNELPEEAYREHRAFLREKRRAASGRHD
ncbi:MAG: hypothetical protein KGL39_34345 [Patescibacteria group bacterium]|nr:hypothetical protein [Patescibacteria group bacterium]